MNDFNGMNNIELVWISDKGHLKRIHQSRNLFIAQISKFLFTMQAHHS